MSQAFYEAAADYIGLQEYPGARHNPTIVSFAAASGHSWVQDDETPWCASFVGAILAECGVQGTGRLNARSYLDWGREVSVREAQPGDIVVFWRGSPDAATGHVAFFDHVEGTEIYVLGGNQGNAVNVSPYPMSRLLSIRRYRQPPVPRASATQSTTVQASAAQIVAGVGAAGTGVAALEGTSQLVAVAFGGVVILLAMWIMRERLKKWAAGIR